MGTIKNSIIGIVVAMFIVGLLPTFSSAQTNQAANNSFTDTDEKRAGRSERLQSYRRRYRANISEAKIEAVRQRCEAAQTVAQAYAQRLEDVRLTREQAYAALITRLTSVVDRLENTNVDRTQLDLAVNDLTTESVAFTANMKDYQSMIEDIAIVNCIDNTEEFYAGLQVSRQMRSEMRATSQRLRTFVREDIKSILSTVRSEIANNKSSSGGQ